MEGDGRKREDGQKKENSNKLNSLFLFGTTAMHPNQMFLGASGTLQKDEQKSNVF